MRILPAFALAAAMLSAGCANMSDTQQRTLSGAAIGTAGGAVVGAIAGNAGMGAVIGAGVGAAGGYIHDRQKKAEEENYQRGVADGQAAARN